MKKIIFALMLLITFNSFAQKENNKEIGFYLMDADGNQVKTLNKAATYQVVIKENDTTFIIRTYKNNGSMITQETFKDEGLSIPNGRFVWYDNNGNIDSTGIAEDGKKNGAWQYYSHTFIKGRNGIELISDSIINTVYYNLGKQLTKDEYLGDIQVDTTNSQQAKYPKGVNGWQKYLEGNLDPRLGSLIPQYKNLKDNHAPVTVSFLVEKDGSVNEIFILHSCGYPFDKEVIRIIENSGKWIPAQQGGHDVTYRQKQCIIFSLGAAQYRSQYLQL